MQEADARLLGLPHDLAVSCFSHVEQSALLALRVTCRAMRATASDDALFRRFAGSTCSCGKLLQNASSFARAVASARPCAACAQPQEMFPQRFYTNHAALDAARTSFQEEWTWTGVKPNGECLLLLWPTPHGPRWLMKKREDHPPPDEYLRGRLLTEECASLSRAMLTGVPAAANGWTAAADCSSASSSSSAPLHFFGLGEFPYLEDWLVQFLPEHTALPSRAGSLSAMLAMSIEKRFRSLRDVLRSGDVALLFDAQRLHCSSRADELRKAYPDPPDQGIRALSGMHPVMAVHLPTHKSWSL